MFLRSLFFFATITGACSHVARVSPAAVGVAQPAARFLSTWAPRATHVCRSDSNAASGLTILLKRSKVRVDKIRVSVTPSQFELLRKSLEAVSLRHQVISQNLANVNTPGFRAQEVAFDESLARELAKSQGDLSNVKMDVRAIEGLDERLDGNNVDIDREVTELNKNELLQATYTQMLATKISMMRSAITGR